ncbi:hypothetical protein Amet_4368 [Alkaliphilus metalliredigens QYMF]|uniref:Uncharacterized protein n=1 Tax=Alkaliphilus metalliredigens (strain QYMF) TaxID=293826 RepID=A6TW74_ALKMQ|nr:hypothetical protein [Alkaliphilus metalliredigens]ABR50442.1 hypothetical protein Amet_4368 [Alkaliphilus metalliredigens QYMF]
MQCIKRKFKLQYSKGIKDAITAIKMELRIELENDPELLMKLSEKVDSISKKMEAKNN